MNCKLTNPKTGEPKLFYRTDNGQEFETLREALNSSSRYYTAGVYKNDSDFVELVKSPKFDENTPQGRIQTFIANGVVKTKVVKGKQMFEVTGENSFDRAENKQGVTRYLDTHVGRNNYKMEGNNFYLETDVEMPKIKSPKAMVEEYGMSLGTHLAISEQLKDEEKSPLPTEYSKSELKDLLLGLLQKMGFSTTSISEYAKGYEHRNAIQPSETALIDTIQKIVAFKDGNITTDELTEETAHLIIEGWNQEEVAKLMEQLPQTDIYKKYHNHYTEVYKRHNPGMNDNQVEALVRKEVLGKYLAQHLQSPKSPKTFVEENFFNKMVSLVREFFQNLFVDNKISNDLETFALEIEKHLYNESLAEQLDITDSNVVLFNSTSNSNFRLSMMLRKATEKLKKLSTTYDTSVEGSIVGMQAFLVATEVLQTIQQEAKALQKIQANSEKLGVRLNTIEKTKLKLLIDEFGPMLPKLDQVVRNEIEGVTKVEQETFSNASKETASIIYELETFSSKYHDNEALEIVQRVAKSLNPSGDPDVQAYIERKYYDIQRDHSWLFNFFAPLMLSSNIFVKTIGRITVDMYNLAAAEVNDVFNTYSSTLAKGIPSDFSTGYFITAPINYDDFDLAQQRVIYDLRKMAVGDSAITDKRGKVLTFEEFINTDVSELDKIEGRARVVYDLGFIKAKQQKPDVFGKITPYEQNQLDLVEKVHGVEIEELDQYKEFVLYLQEVRSNQKKHLGIVKTYKEGDPSRIEELNVQKSLERKQASPFAQHVDLNIFDGEGTEIQFLNKMAKKGIEFTTTPDNDTVLWQEKTATGEKVYVKLGELDGLTPHEELIAFKTYFHLKTKAAQTAKFKTPGPDGSFTKPDFNNLKDAYEKFKKTQDYTQSPVQINEQRKNWLYSNMNFSFTDEFFEGLAGGSYDTDDLTLEQEFEVRKRERKLNALNRIKRTMLNQSAHFKSFNEYNSEMFTAFERTQIDEIDNKMHEIRMEIFGVYSQAEVEMTKGSSLARNKPNKSYLEQFENVTGTPYANATIEQKEAFFKKISSSRAFTSYFNYKSDLKSGRMSRSQREYISNMLEDNNLSADIDSNDMDTVLTLLMESRIPSYYLRFEPKSANSYADYVNAIEAGDIQIDDVMYDIEKNLLPEYVEVTIASKYNDYDPNELSKMDLIEQYQNSEDTEEKLTILEDIANLSRVGDKFKNKNFRQTIRGREDQYLALMDIIIGAHENFGMLDTVNIFKQPEFRKSGLARTKSLAANKDRITQMSDEFMESISFRPDEKEDAYKEGQSIHAIPKYGYYRLTPSERSTDLVETYMKFYQESAIYKQRKNSYHEVSTLYETLRERDFKGDKTGEDTKVIKALEEYTAQHYFGKRSVQHYEIDIAGRKVDAAKIMLKMRNFIAMMGIGTSPIVALTAFTTGKFQEYLTFAGGKEFYAPAHKRASLEYKKLMGQGVGDIGTLEGGSKLESILRHLGLHDPQKRFTNAEYGRVAKNLSIENFSYGMLSASSLPQEAKIAVSVLMEYREIDGTIYNFEQFRTKKKVVDGVTDEAAIKQEFDSHSRNSLYDNYDPKLLFKIDGISEEVRKKVQIEVMSRSQELVRRILAQMPKGGDVLAKSHPLLGYMYTYRSWFTNAAYYMMDGIDKGIPKDLRTKDGVKYERNLNTSTGNMEIGRLPAMIEAMRNLDPKKGLGAFKAAWESTDDAGRQALREMMVAHGIMTALVGIAAILMAYADDDEDNYPLQLLSYLSTRTLNEAFSAGNPLGIANEFLEFVENPVVVARTIKNIVGVTNLGKIGDTIESGPYKGWNKYLADLFKITSLRNMKVMSSAETLKSTRESYMFFNSRENTFSALPLIKQFMALGVSEEDEE